MKTLTVSLSAQQSRMLREAVEAGQYASNSEVVRDALRLWEQREKIRNLEIGRLKQAYDEGKASGEGREVDVQTLLAELKAEKKAHGAR